MQNCSNNCYNLACIAWLFKPFYRVEKAAKPCKRAPQPREVWKREKNCIQVPFVTNSKFTWFMITLFEPQNVKKLVLVQCREHKYGLDSWVCVIPIVVCLLNVSLVMPLSYCSNTAIGFGSHRERCLNQIKDDSCAKKWTVTTGITWTNTYVETLNLMNLSRWSKCAYILP